MRDGAALASDRPRLVTRQTCAWRQDASGNQGITGYSNRAAAIRRIPADVSRRPLDHEGTEREDTERRGPRSVDGTLPGDAGHRLAPGDTAGQPVLMPVTRRSLGSERGLATPSPDGKGETTLGPFKEDHAA